MAATDSNVLKLAPEPGAPFPHAALPVDIETALPVDAIWQRWLAHDPIVRLDARPDAMKEAAYVFLDAGDRDEHGLQIGARLVRDRLVARGVRVSHEEFPGGHRGTAYRYDVSLPAMLAEVERS